MKENEENSLETFLKGCENNVRTLESLTERATALKSGKRKRETYEKPSYNSKTSPSTTSSCSKKYSGDERTSSIVETSLLFSTLLKKKVRTLGKIKQTFFSISTDYIALSLSFTIIILKSLSLNITPS
jgi:transcriptional regulator with AAA-type ATPase domain